MPDAPAPTATELRVRLSGHRLNHLPKTNTRGIYTRAWCQQLGIPSPADPNTNNCRKCDRAQQAAAKEGEA